MLGMRMLGMQAITKQVLTAVDHLHRNNICHKDIKPVLPHLSSSSSSSSFVFSFSSSSSSCPAPLPSAAALQKGNTCPLEPGEDRGGGGGGGWSIALGLALGIALALAFAFALALGLDLGLGPLGLSPTRGADFSGSMGFPRAAGDRVTGG